MKTRVLRPIYFHFEYNMIYEVESAFENYLWQSNRNSSLLELTCIFHLLNTQNEPMSKSKGEIFLIKTRWILKFII